MNWANVAWMLFSIPGATIITFIGLSFSAYGIYTLSDVIKVLPRPVENGSTGLRETLARWRRIVRIVRHRNRSLGRRVAINTTLSLIGAILGAFWFGFMAATVICIPVIVARDLLGVRPANEASILLLWLLGALFGVKSLFRSMRYLSSSGRKPKLSDLPRISFAPGEVSWTRRTQFLRNAYRHHHLRFAVKASFILGVLSLAVASGPAKFEPTAAAHTSTAADDSLWLAGLVLGLVTRWLLLAGIDLINPAMGSVFAIHRFMNPTRPPKPVRATSVTDPLGRQRAQLTRVARLLVRTARRQEVSAPLHPIASILRGMVLQVHQNLSRVDSLRSTPPVVLTMLLKTVPTLLAGPRSMDSYQRIANAADAFDVKGNPIPELRLAVRGRWVAFTNVILELLETYARFFAAIWSLFLLAASIYLLTTGKLSLDNIQFEK